MPKIIQLIDSDSDGHKFRLDNGTLVTVPYGGGHYSVGDTFGDPGSVHRMSMAPTVEQLESPAQVAANVLSELVKIHSDFNQITSPEITEAGKDVGLSGNFSAPIIDVDWSEPEAEPKPLPPEEFKARMSEAAENLIQAAVDDIIANTVTDPEATDAVSEPETAGSDGDSGAPTEQAPEAQPGPAEDEPSTTA